jgi:dTDP-4-dehydrorhamnose 3,5-epimerase
MEPVLITDITKFKDSRGFFYESFKSSVMRDKHGIVENFVQDNHSVSSKNTIRGMHYQWNGPMGKLVRVVSGAIVDVIVDIRKNSPTFGEVNYYELNDENLHQLYVPAGFAHGFRCLSDAATVIYKCTEEYNRKGESGIDPFDGELNIDWGISSDDAIISEKDFLSKSFREYSREPRF